MKAVIQRVSNASVEIDGVVKGEIDKGLLVLLGVMNGDTSQQADFMAQKITQLRIFTDDNDKMNLSLEDIDGEMLIISNFTLGADCKKGRRPYFVQAAPPDLAQELYDYFVEQVKKLNVKNVQTGEFGADMQVSLLNDGPVTIILDTEEIGK